MIVETLLPRNRTEIPFGEEHPFLHVRNLDWENLAVQFSGKYALQVAQSTDEDEAVVAEKFRERTDDLKVYLSTLTRNVATNGHFNSAEGSIVIEGGLQIPERISALTHETAHAVAINERYTHEDKSSGYTRLVSGIDRKHYDAHNNQVALPGDIASTWINESLVSLLSAKADTTDFRAGYLTGTLLLSSLFEIDPELESNLLQAAYLDGEIEEALTKIDLLGKYGWSDRVGRCFERIIDFRHGHIIEHRRPIDEIHEIVGSEISDMMRKKYQALQY